MQTEDETAPAGGRDARREEKAAAKAAKKREKAAQKQAAAEGRMTLIEHLIEFRRRLLISLAAVVIGAIVMFFLYNWLITLLSGPYAAVTKGQTSCGGTADTGCKLIFTGVLEPFMVRIKIAGYGGLALAVPVVFWEIWRFVTPALHSHERRYAIGFAVSSVFLFALGAVVAWLTLEPALTFLFGVGGPELQPLIKADQYITLVLLMVAAFGVAFELPILLVFLLLVRVLTTAQLRAARRWAAVGIVVFAAIITPSQDPISLLLMAVPMYLLYEISILVGRLMKR